MIDDGREVESRTLIITVVGNLTFAERPRVDVPPMANQGESGTGFTVVRSDTSSTSTETRFTETSDSDLGAVVATLRMRLQ